MRLPRVRFTVRRLMVAVAVVALACGFDWPGLWAPSPRTLLPLMTALYLAWAALDGLRIVRAGRPSWGPRERLAFTAIAVLFLAALVAQDRWAFFRRRVAYHDGEEQLYRWSAEGKRGTILAYCRKGGCQSYPIPEANTALDRAEMLKTAEFHARMKLIAARDGAVLTRGFAVLIGSVLLGGWLGLLSRSNTTRPGSSAE